MVSVVVVVVVSYLEVLNNTRYGTVDWYSYFIYSRICLVVFFFLFMIGSVGLMRRRVLAVYVYSTYTSYVRVLFFYLVYARSFVF